MSLPEVLLWQQLRGQRVGGLRFRRQHPIDDYVADFYCHELGLVVEVDGHHHAQQQQHDAARDAHMHARGLTVLRLPAWRVLSDMESMLREVLRAAEAIRSRRTTPEQS